VLRRSARSSEQQCNATEDLTTGGGAGGLLAQPFPELPSAEREALTAVTRLLAAAREAGLKGRQARVRELHERALALAEATLPRASSLLIARLAYNAFRARLFADAGVFAVLDAPGNTFSNNGGVFYERAAEVF
jgi:hypothetical protein